MEVINVKRNFTNRWDKDSIRPGPVGSVGDVNLQVKLKHSSPDLPVRYESIFSKENEKWTGSNISDGQWYGFTSGGRGAITIRENWTNDTPFKTGVGYKIENIIPVDRSRIVKTVPLGNYDWDAQKSRIYSAKVTGDAFLPLPLGYDKPENLLPRGSQFPRPIAESVGTGVAMPAADVKITDPIFGETGSIDLPGTEKTDCEPWEKEAIFTLGEFDPRPVPSDYPYLAVNALGQVYNGWPEHKADTAFNKKTKKFEHFLRFSIHGTKNVPAGFAPVECKITEPARRVPQPGNQDKRREEEKNKKQKMR